MNINALLLCLVSVFCGAEYAVAVDWKIQDDAKNKVTFEAVGNPGFLRVNGEGAKAAGTLSEKEGKIVGEVTVETVKFTTGMETRDKHMREKYLGIEKATFMLDPVLPNANGFDFSGKLTVKKDTVAVKGKGKINTTSTGQEFTGSFKVSLKDLPSIGVPSYLGVTIAEEVTVNITFLASDK